MTAYQQKLQKEAAAFKAKMEAELVEVGAIATIGAREYQGVVTNVSVHSAVVKTCGSRSYKATTAIEAIKEFCKLTFKSGRIKITERRQDEDGSFVINAQVFAQ